MSFVFSDLGKMPSVGEGEIFATPKYLVECVSNIVPPHLGMFLVFVYDHACNHLYTEGVRGSPSTLGVYGNILYLREGLPFDLEKRQRTTTAPPFQESADIVFPELWEWAGGCHVKKARIFGSYDLAEYKDLGRLQGSAGNKDFIRLYSDDGSVIKEWPGGLCEAWIEGNTLLLWIDATEPFEGDDLKDIYYMPRSYLRLYKVERV